MFASKDIFQTASTGGYKISRSVRLRSSASAYLNRTPASAGNRKTWTWSGWVKRGKQGAINYIFGAPSSYTTAFRFNSTNTFFFTGASGTQFIFETTAVYRDSSAWYHVVIALDTTQATSTNRVKIYINGNQVTAFASATYPSLNLDGEINNAHYHGIGTSSSSDTHDGYLTEINFIDGQALTPSSFGETNAITGVWQPKKYGGTYGTNGFYLNFSDNSTAAALGTDFSGNSNTWTVNNISVTAGVTYDSMLDVPTPYADGGNGRGNYAVLNPLVPATSFTPTGGNLNVSATGTFSGSIGTAGTMEMTSAYYYEIALTTNSNANAYFGVSSNPNISSAVGFTSTSWAFAPLGSGAGNKYNNGSSTAFAGGSYTANGAGVVFGVAVDATNGRFYVRDASGWINGTSVDATPTTAVYTGLPTTLYPAIGMQSGTSQTVTASINFGQRPFTYTPPTGFVALNTQNLPAPTISNGASYMAATTYTGTLVSNAVSNAVNGVSFQPDLVWIKSRSAATDNELTDSVRGATLSLTSNSTAAEATDLQGLTAFNSGGFTVGTNTTYNNLAATYVAWQWNAGGSTVTNTSGSISAQVRANATAGFSVVTYTGTGSTGTVGHGLGVAPKMIISKNRSAAEEWRVGHIGLTNMASWHINLNGTGAQSNSGAAIWNNTAPTSTIFGVGTDTSVSGNGNLIVAYCFAAVAGYSAFGSYTGNGSTDGPFVFTGFRPRFVLFKRTDVANDWAIIDTARNTFNVATQVLFPNSSSAEGTQTTPMDILSNGFKVRNGADNYINANGGTYIYMAFAENPFKLSLAR